MLKHYYSSQYSFEMLMTNRNPVKHSIEYPSTRRLPQSSLVLDQTLNIQHNALIIVVITTASTFTIKYINNVTPSQTTKTNKIKTLFITNSIWQFNTCRHSITEFIEILYAHMYPVILH